MTFEELQKKRLILSNELKKYTESTFTYHHLCDELDDLDRLIEKEKLRILVKDK